MFFCLRHSVYKMENLEYRIIYEYKFHRGTSVAENARRVDDMYGGRIVKYTLWFLIQRFCSGNFNL